MHSACYVQTHLLHVAKNITVSGRGGAQFAQGSWLTLDQHLSYLLLELLKSIAANAFAAISNCTGLGNPLSMLVLYPSSMHH